MLQPHPPPLSFFVLWRRKLGQGAIGKGDGSTRSSMPKNRITNNFNLAHIALLCSMPKKGRPISSAILKYGLVNFAFIVIEEVDTDLHNIEIRETYWIKHIKPSPRYPYRKILFFFQKTKKCFAPLLFILISAVLRSTAG